MIASGNKYLGQIRRQLVTILKCQHFTTSRVSNSAGLSLNLIAPDSYYTLFGKALPCWVKGFIIIPHTSANLHYISFRTVVAKFTL